MSKYIASLVGNIVFFLLFLLIDLTDRLINYKISVSFDASAWVVLSYIVKLILVPLAVSMLGLFKIINAKKFDLKLFALFLLFGVFFIFNQWLLSFTNLIPQSLVTYSKFGGVIVGVGIILSIKTNSETSSKTVRQGTADLKDLDLKS